MAPAVLFLVFNRPGLTRRTFDAIRAARPTRLFIHADGPRPHRPDDVERCRAVRSMVEAVDWPCEVHRLFRDVNLGCGPAVSDALNWFFAQVDEGIVLEDDCIPHAAFFSYAAHMLERYRDDPRVLHISGMGFLPTDRSANAPAVYLAPFPFVWGWASWSRAWRQFRLALPSATEIERTVSRRVQRGVDRRYWCDKFRRTASGEISSWGYPWVYTLWANDGLAVTPTVSLVSNQGLHEDATHPADDKPPAFAPCPPSATFPFEAVPECTVSANEFLVAVNDRLFFTTLNAPAPRWLAAVLRTRFCSYLYFGFRRRWLSIFGSMPSREQQAPAD